MPSAVVDSVLAPQLAACSERLAARLGLHFPPERWPDLMRAVDAAAPKLGCGSSRDCLARLATASLTPAQIDALVPHLAVGETYFLRQPAAFAALRERILPGLIAARRGEARRLRIWSAGCSSGEEPYSIAITLAESLPELQRWNIAILASDINPLALARAREACYSGWSFRGVGADIRARYFSHQADGRYRLAPDLRALVSVVPLNLAEDCYPAVETNTNAMDVIFCRNVLMYFHPERARAVVERLARCLVEGGWLVVSAVEGSLVKTPSLQPHRLSDLIVFRKESGVRAEASVPPQGEPAATAAALARRRAAPATGAAPLSLAAALYREGRYDEAATALEGLLAQGRARAEALLLLARAQANRGHLREALARCDEALALAALDPAASYLRASILLELGQPQSAAEAFRRTLYLNPECPLAHFSLGNLLANEGHRPAARRHYRQALAILDTLPPARPLREADGLPAGRLREMIAAAIDVGGLP